MTWSNRLRLVVGLVLVVGVVAVSTDHLNERRGRAESTSAQVAAEEYVVGTPYAGLVVEQPVTVGDTVRAGDALLVIDSATMQRDLAEGYVQPRAEAGDVDAEGRLVLRATADGVLVGVDTAPGSFVQPGAQVATVRHAGSVHVLAEYQLTASEYGRLDDGAEVSVRLADGRELLAHVSDLSVVTTDSGDTRVLLAVGSDELDALAAADRLVAPGAPVQAVVRLRNEGLVSDVSAAVKGYLASAVDGVTGALAGGA